MTKMRTAPILLLVSTLVLGGCSFRPLYGSGKHAVSQAELSSVSVDEPQNRPTQLVRNELLSVMTGSDGRYRLILDVRSRDGRVARLPRTNTTRFEHQMTGRYKLYSVASSKVVFTGVSSATVPYDTLREPVADRQAQSNAMERAAVEIAQSIHLKISLFLSRSGS